MRFRISRQSHRRPWHEPQVTTPPVPGAQRVMLHDGKVQGWEIDIASLDELLALAGPLEGLGVGRGHWVSDGLPSIEIRDVSQP